MGQLSLLKINKYSAFVNTTVWIRNCLYNSFICKKNALLQLIKIGEGGVSQAMIISLLLCFASYAQDKIFENHKPYIK